MKKILLIHWFWCNQDSYFFPFLKKELENYWKVFCPNFPDSENPSLQNREKHLLKIWEKNFDLVLSHSLWWLFWLNLISRWILKTKNLVNIWSPFWIRKKESINTFLENFTSTDSIIKNAEKIIIAHSFDDPWVDSEYWILLVKNLKAKWYFYSDKWHFETKSLPENLMREIKFLLK